MSVRGNPEGSTIRRKAFTGDVASMGTPAANPDPTTPRGKRRREKGRAARKTPEILIKGRAHRPHSHPGKMNGPTVKGHLITDSHCQFVLLTRAYKRNH